MIMLYAAVASPHFPPDNIKEPSFLRLSTAFSNIQTCSAWLRRAPWSLRALARSLSMRSALASWSPYRQQGMLSGLIRDILQVL